MTPRTRRWPVTVTSRAVAMTATVALLGMLPWLSRNRPEYTILRARYADREPTPEVLAQIRADLGIDRGPLVVFTEWAREAVTGDFGTSWISGRPVGPGLVQALGVSLTLMAGALIVAVALTVLKYLPLMR